LSSRHKTNYQYEVQQLVQCPKASPGPVVPASGMCTAVNRSSWDYNPVFERHVSSSQASQPSLSSFQCHNCTINVYQGPVSQPHNSDQHGVRVMRLVRKIWKVLKSSNCDVYMAYSVNFMSVALMQTYLFLYGGSYLCNVTHDLLAVMGILIIFSSLFDTIAVHGFPGYVSNIKGIYMPSLVLGPSLKPGPDRTRPEIGRKQTRTSIIPHACASHSEVSII